MRCTRFCRNLLVAHAAASSPTRSSARRQVSVYSSHSRGQIFSGMHSAVPISVFRPSASPATTIAAAHPAHPHASLFWLRVRHSGSSQVSRDGGEDRCAAPISHGCIRFITRSPPAGHRAIIPVPCDVFKAVELPDDDGGAVAVLWIACSSGGAGGRNQSHAMVATPSSHRSNIFSTQVKQAAAAIDRIPTPSRGCVAQATIYSSCTVTSSSQRRPRIRCFRRCGGTSSGSAPPTKTSHCAAAMRR